MQTIISASFDSETIRD